MCAGAVALCCGSFGQGSGPVHMNSVVCSGSEPNITSCSYSATGSEHQEEVGVQCQPRTTSGIYLHIPKHYTVINTHASTTSATWQYSSGWRLLPVGRSSGDILVRDLGHS